MPDGEKGTHTEAFHLQFCSATYLSQFNSDFDAAKTKISLRSIRIRIDTLKAPHLLSWAK